jgi:hypothetical protein
VTECAKPDQLQLRCRGQLPTTDRAAASQGSHGPLAAPPRPPQHGAPQSTGQRHGAAWRVVGGRSGPGGVERSRHRLCRARFSLFHSATPFTALSPSAVCGFFSRSGAYGARPRSDGVGCITVSSWHIGQRDQRRRR